MASERLVHIVGTDVDRCQALQELLRSAGITAVIYETADAFLESAAKLRAGCVLVDPATPGVNGPALQTRLKRLGSSLPVIATTPKGDVTTAVEAMKAGAVDFIEGPVDDQRLLAAIEAALASRAMSQAPRNRCGRRGGLPC